MQLKDLLKKVLTKKAKGYTVKERTEDYTVSEGEAILVKRKIVTKHIAPDINAVKALLQLSELTDSDVSTMTDSQLEIERLRLLGMLKVCEGMESDSTQSSEEDNTDD